MESVDGHKSIGFSQVNNLLSALRLSRRNPPKFTKSGQFVYILETHQNQIINLFILETHQSQ